ncbi:MAG: methyltransferase domain-containing protein [Burkholderiaceae bacterium]
MNTKSKNKDPYSSTDQLDAETLETVASRLENRGRDPYFNGIIDQYLSQLIRRSPNRVLELGCGTGLVSRLLAKTDGFDGQIVATDLSPGLIERASNLVASDGLSDIINCLAGDARDIALPENSFDAVIAHTLVSHVPDVDAVFATVSRLLKSDGVVIICDGDFSSITLGGSNPPQGQQLARAITEGMFTNPAVMRELPVIAKRHGLRVDNLVGNLLCEAGGARYFADLFPTLRVLLPKAGVASQAQADEWIDTQESDIADSVFFGSMNFYTWTLTPASRPQGQ